MCTSDGWLFSFLFKFLFLFVYSWADEPGAAGGSTPVAPVNLEGGGAAKNISALGGGDTPGLTAIDLKSIIPPEYAGKDYMKEIIAKNDINGLLKSLDNAQGLIGKKLGIPTAESTPEERAKFFETLGKPKVHTEYNIKREGMDDKTMEYFQKVFHSADMTKAQSEKLMAALDQMGKDGAAASAAAAKVQDEAFDKLVADTFGDRADEAIANAKSYMSKYVPKEFHAKLDAAPNEVLVAITAFVDNIVKNFTKEDSIIGGKGGNAPTSYTVDDVQAKMTELYNSPEYRDAFSSGHNAALSKERDLKEKLTTLLRRK